MAICPGCQCSRHFTTWFLDMGAVCHGAYPLPSILSLLRDTLAPPAPVQVAVQTAWLRQGCASSIAMTARHHPLYTISHEKDHPTDDSLKHVFPEQMRIQLYHRSKKKSTPPVLGLRNERQVISISEKGNMFFSNCAFSLEGYAQQGEWFSMGVRVDNFFIYFCGLTVGSAACQRTMQKHSVSTSRFSSKGQNH